MFSFKILLLFSVFGFRGDLEILGYNLVHWLNGSLPWEKDISNAAIVENEKIEMMSNPSAYSKKHALDLPKGNMIIYWLSF